MLRKVKFLFLLAATVVVNMLVLWSNGSIKFSRPNASCGCNMTENIFKVYRNRSAEHITINKTRRTANKSVYVSSGKAAVDIINGYYPYVDFKFVYPDITPDLKLTIRDIFLVVFVNSAAKGHRSRRDVIRRTWGNHKTCEQMKAIKDTRLKSFEWMLVFLVGKTGTQEDQMNLEEAKQHNDMLIGDIVDNYLNNIIKLYMGNLWASLLAPRYILKTDDDVYVRIPGVIEYLFYMNFPSRFYGGKTYKASSVFRKPTSKWGISVKYYPHKIWPPFNAGAFYIISSDLVGSLFDYIKHRKPFHTDDAYVGVAMKDLKVDVTDILSFDVKMNMNKLIRSKSDCEVLALVGFAHGVEPESLEFVHRRLESMCRRNITINSCSRF